MKEYIQTISPSVLYGGLWSAHALAFSLQLLVEHEGGLATDPKFQYLDRENPVTSAPIQQSNP